MAAGKKRSGRIFIIIILIIAVGAVLAYLLLTNNTGLFNFSAAPAQPEITPTPNVELVDIVIASQTITRGTLITSEVLTTIKYPKNQVPEGTFFSTIEEAVGTKAKYDIDPAVPLTTSMVIHEDGGSLVSFDIPDGMTAFSIPVSPETAVAFAPQKGDHVMVVGCMLLTDLDTEFQSRLPNSINTTFAPPGTQSDLGTANALTVKPSDAASLSFYGRYELDPATNYFVYLTATESQRPRLVCQTILQDATILQVGMFAASDLSATAATPTPAVEPVPPVTSNSYSGSVTLIVSPQDTLVLNYLLLSGTKLSLALRSAGDSTAIVTDPVTLQYVMEQKDIPSPVKLPYSVEPRVDSLVYPGFNDYILIQP